ncbi:MAG TPA: TonB-dependent receptor [Ignavibacteriaceae bacterium]|nr:TonB-dependent receptor [Ignavibacteriaceae bacterium]
MYSRISFFILLFISIITVNAQNTGSTVNLIKGKVLDAEQNEPLVGVNVFIKELRNGTVTNEDGIFEFDNINEGNYSIAFSYVGHKPVTVEVTVPSENAQNINVKLEETTINLSEVTVTGNPFLSEAKDLSQTTIAIDKLDLIIKSGGTVADALDFQPGVAMRSNGIATGRPVIRGFSNNKVLILEDGLRMGDLSNASDDHSVTDDGSEAEKIEVIEGPSSLLYGSNAIGGVVNIITDAVPSTIQNGLSGELQLGGAGVNNEYLGNAHVNYGIGNLSLHGKFSKRKGEDYRIGGGSKTFNSDLQTENGLVGASLLSDWGMAGISFEDFNNVYGLPTTPAADEIVYIDMHKKQYKLAANFDKIKSFITSVDVKAGYLDYTHSEISRVTGETGTKFGLKTGSADISFLHQPLSANSSGVIGLYGLVQNYTVTGDEALTPNADYYNFAAYFLEKFKWETLNLSFGLRYELNQVKFPDAVLTDSSFSGGKKNFNSLSASIGLVYNLTDNISLFTNLANAFRAPTIEELSSYAIHDALASFDIGNRSLKRENSTGIDFGLRSRSDKYFFEAMGYYYKVFDLIYRSPLDQYFSEETDTVSGEPIGFNTNGDGFQVHQYEQADAIVYGLESKLNFEILPAWSGTLISDYVRGKNQTTDENLPQIPPFRFSIETRYAPHQYWIGAVWKLASGQNLVAPNEERTPGYGLISIYAGYKFFTGRFVHIIDLKADNLLDQRYKDHLSAIKDFTYMPGRNITLGYKFVF